MSAGRPSKYSPEFITKLLAYFDVQLYTVRNGKKEVNPMPTFEGFCFDNKVSHQTLLDWCKAHKEFLEAYNACKQKQKQMIVQGGMLGAYNAQFTIFVAKNVTDMKDRVETIDVTQIETEKLKEEARKLLGEI
jgi:hypothetical protein